MMEKNLKTVFFVNAYASKPCNKDNETSYEDWMKALLTDVVFFMK